MRLGIALTLTTSILLAGTSLATSAATPPGGSSVRFTTSLQSPHGTTSSSGTLTVQTTRPGAVALTIQNDDGKPPQTVALIAGAGGSFTSDPTAPGRQNLGATILAQKYMSDLTVANYAGSGASSSQDAPNFELPVVTIIPAGTGAAVQTQFALIRNSNVYTGGTQVATTTTVPGYGTNLSDTVNLVLTVSSANGRISVIQGVQTDTIIVRRDKSGKVTKQIMIQARWAISAATG